MGASGRQSVDGEAVNFDLIISEQSRAYLEVQRGGIYALRKDRDEWTRCYLEGLGESFESMVRHLPARCMSLLDVGSGLGGIDVYLSRHYDGVPRITLLDGEADDPVCSLNRETKSSRLAAIAFHRDNDIDVEYLSPDLLVPRPCDLIISTGAWCFHFPPSEYMNFVQSCVAPDGATIILDVRKDRPEWQRELAVAFGRPTTIIDERKRLRQVYRCSARG